MRAAQFGVPATVRGLGIAAAVAGLFAGASLHAQTGAAQTTNPGAQESSSGTAAETTPVNAAPVCA